MRPEDLKAMGFDKEVFPCEGILHPVMYGKIKCCQEKYFASRLLSRGGGSDSCLRIEGVRDYFMCSSVQVAR